MKTYTVEVLPGEPIILTTILEGYRIAEDMPKSEVEVRAILDQASESMFYIINISALSFSINDVIMASNRGARGKQPLWHHPNLRQMIFVHPSRLVKMAAAGLNTATFGNLSVMVFDTLEEALAYVRAELNRT